MPLPAKEDLVSTEGKLRQGSDSRAQHNLGLTELSEFGVYRHWNWTTWAWHTPRVLWRALRRHRCRENACGMSAPACPRALPGDFAQDQEQVFDTYNTGQQIRKGVIHKSTRMCVSGESRKGAVHATTGRWCWLWKQKLPGYWANQTSPGMGGVLALGLASVALQGCCQPRPAEGQVAAVGAAPPLQSSKPAGVSDTSAAHENTRHRDYFCLFAFCLDTGPG